MTLFTRLRAILTRRPTPAICEECGDELGTNHQTCQKCADAKTEEGAI